MTRATPVFPRGPGRPRRYFQVLNSLCLSYHLRAHSSHFRAYSPQPGMCCRTMECYLLSGDSDYMIRVVVSDVRSLERFIVDDLSKLASIAKHSLQLRAETGQVQDRIAFAGHFYEETGAAPYTAADRLKRRLDPAGVWAGAAAPGSPARRLNCVAGRSIALLVLVASSGTCTTPSRSHGSGSEIERAHLYGWCATSAITSHHRQRRCGVGHGPHGCRPRRRARPTDTFRMISNVVCSGRGAWLGVRVLAGQRCFPGTYRGWMTNSDG
jgi:hypothetical protein